MIETMCETLNTRNYGAAVMANLEGAFDTIWRKGKVCFINFTKQVLKAYS